MSITRKCEIIECDNDTKSKGLCNKHYQRIRRNGTIEPRETICHMPEYSSWLHMRSRCYNPRYNKSKQKWS